MVEPLIYVSGEFVPQGKARLPVMDHAVLYGDGVFETAMSWDRRVFKLDRHVDRFFRSARAIALDPGFDAATLRRLVCEAIRRNRLDHAYVKWILTRGSNDSPLMDPTGCVPNLIILTRAYAHRPRAGLRMKTSAMRRPSGQVLDPKIKSLNYLNLVMAKIEAKAAGADEALMLDQAGHVCEAPGANVFALSGTRLATPARDVLEGVTRETVLELAPAAGLEPVVGDVDLYDLHTADEVFITSTAGGLAPVTEIDGRRIGDGRVGPVFTRLADAYHALLVEGRHGTSIDMAEPAAA
ncbi:MAG: aminotransferase class IV [Alphaproteobacteria bacterium]